MTYAQVLDYIERNNEDGEDGIYWKFRRIVSHRAVNQDDPDYMNSAYNLWIEWEDGSITIVPLSLFFEDAPYKCAM